MHLVPRGLDRRQRQVRVERRVALAGEVLGARREPAALHAVDPRDAVARDDGRVLAVGADADVRAVALGERVEHRRQVQVHAEPPELARLEEPLARGEGLLARGPDREVVGEDRDAASEHDHAPALVVGRHEEPPAERRLEAGEQVEEPGRAVEVAAVEDQAGSARVAEEADVLLPERRPGQADHEALADEVLDFRHPTILARAPSAG